MSDRIAVVHLVRQANGPVPLDAFLSSYELHDAGVDHELVLLCKGFDDAESLAPVRRRARGLGAREVMVSDDGFDISAYLAAARELSHDRLCFVNSYSTILVPGWLAKLSAPLDTPGTGVTGATGSWGSHSSLQLAVLGLPNGYGIPMGDRAALEETPATADDGAAPPHRVRALAEAFLKLPRLVVDYPGFPAPHVRTNAFVIERDLLRSVHGVKALTKSEAYRFEGGTRGLTGQLRKQELAAVVVGRDGVVHGHESWPDADLFWQGRQRDLLVADNQTRMYEHGSPAVRLALARYAWGPRARPA